MSLTGWAWQTLAMSSALAPYSIAKTNSLISSPAYWKEGRGGKGREREERGGKGREGEGKGGKGREREERGGKGREGKGIGEGRGGEGRGEGNIIQFILIPTSPTPYPALPLPLTVPMM